jgi:signal transduction histidine kinase
MADNERWERYLDRGVEVLPYILLLGSTAFTMIQPDQTWAERLIILGLAAVAAAWMLWMFTLRPPAWRHRTGLMVVYYVGTLAIAAVLTTRSPFFVAFVCTGFIQAFVVLPTPLAFAGLVATSVVIYTRPGEFPKLTVASLSIWLFIIALQTALTGFFSYMGIKLTGEHQKRRELVAQLESALEENAGLHAQLLVQAREAGVLDERQRMAREIHDTLAQGLTGIITQLEAAERVREHPGQRQRHLDQARELARENLTEARRSLQALGPQPLEGARLPEAIADMARRWSDGSAVSLTLETTGEPRPLLAEVEATLFRVAQEALTNVGKHAGASKVGLTLSYMPDTVLLDVRDDGVGFDPASVGSAGSNGSAGEGHGYGLTAMRRRLQRVAGNLEVESAPGEGTAINASVPAIPAEGGE